MTKIRTYGFFLAALGLSLATAARADVAPDAKDLRVYSVELSKDMSALLLESVNFNSQKHVQAHEAEQWCADHKVMERVYKSARGDGSTTITCREATYCRGRIPATCTLTFTGFRDQKSEDLLKVLSAKPVKK